MLPPMSTPSVFWMLVSCLMLICFQVQGEDSETESLSPRFSCPDGTMGQDKYCYAFFITPKSWLEASIACQNWRPSHLASVRSKSEASFVAIVINNNPDNDMDTWIGLHDPTEKGNGWQWSNKDVMSYTAWEENSCPSYEGYCGRVTKDSGFMKWKGTKCETKLPYVCKFKSN
ncbi:lithostathine-like [Suncus etruscus]|uniref:lithostathine-like n=1 Tax=Suncus etruscus TaxID=109475 RepID=UPI002110AF43|nr:lithostathine-like [Suncus etruscus]